MYLLDMSCGHRKPSTLVLSPDMSLRSGFCIDLLDTVRTRLSWWQSRLRTYISPQDTLHALHKRQLHFHVWWLFARLQLGTDRLDMGRKPDFGWQYQPAR